MEFQSHSLLQTITHQEWLTTNNLKSSKIKVRHNRYTEHQSHHQPLRTKLKLARLTQD